MNGVDNGQLGTIEGYHAKADIDVIGYAVHNLAFKDSYFGTTGGANGYNKSARQFPRTRAGNPNGEVCMLHNTQVSGSFALPSVDGAIYAYNTTFLGDNAGMWYNNGNYAKNQADDVAGIYGYIASPEIVLHNSSQG